MGPLLAVPAALLVAWIAGIAFAPALLTYSPLLLVALAPEGRHLLLAAPLVDPILFVVVVTVRLLAADPFLYLFGARYGDEGVRWMERRSGSVGRFARWLERLFARWWGPIVFLSSGPIVCVLAGASKVRFVPFMVVNVAGSLATAALYMFFADALSEWTGIIRDFVAREVVAFTVVSCVLAGLWAYRSARRAQNAESPSTE